MCRSIFTVCFFLFSQTFYAQESNAASDEVYRLKPAVDIPVTAALASWSLYGFSQIYSKPSSSEYAIQALNKENIPWFDRWAAGKYSPANKTRSDLPFYAAMPLPVLLFLKKDIRQDFLKITFLYLETMSVTGLFYTGSAYLWDRYRPFVYNTSVPMAEKTSGNNRNSFLGGHPALVASSTFFIAKVYSDYYPDSKMKYFLYGGAAFATGLTAYYRHIAGMHFPSDLLVGVAAGTATGILVPHFHKNRPASSTALNIIPFTGQYNGLALLYKF